MRPATRAAEVEQAQCDPGVTGDVEHRAVDTSTVIAVEPIYSWVHTATTGTDKKVAGVKLVIRQPEAMDAERLTRALQCHGARALLGRPGSVQVPDDPYWLPDAWLDIDVVPEAGNLAVTLRADGICQNLRVLGRARAFAAAHRRTRSGAAPTGT